MVGEEMFYSKVRTDNTHLMLEMNSPSLLKFPLLQKRTWESNKNDIRICRMKGKHEVSGYCHKQMHIFGLYVRNINAYYSTHTFINLFIVECRRLAITIIL